MSLLLLFATPPSIETDKSTYVPGENIEVTWDGAGALLSRIAIALDGADANTFVDWVYTDGTQTPPGSPTPSGSHTFTAPSAGTYVARILDETGDVDNTYTHVRKNGGSGAAYDASAYTGLDYMTDVEVTFRLVVAGSDFFAVGLRDTANADDNYDTGYGILIDSGTIYYTVGLTYTSTGVSLASGNLARIARTISDGAIKIYKSTDNGGSWTLVHTFTPTSTAPLGVDTSFLTANTWTTIVVTEGGAPNAPTWFSTNTAVVDQTISTDAPTYTAGSPITISFTGGVTATDWISIQVAGSDPYLSGSVVVWKYLNDSISAPGAPVASGTVQLTAPSAGTYEVLLMYNDQYRPMLQVITITTT